jgi:hypothetical protein
MSAGHGARVGCHATLRHDVRARARIVVKHLWYVCARIDMPSAIGQTVASQSTNVTKCVCVALLLSTSRESVTRAARIGSADNMTCRCYKLEYAQTL